jgi:hypothetical protein
MVFHKIPTVEFDFTAISIKDCDVSIDTSVRVCGGERGEGYWVQISTPMHFNTPFRSCFSKLTVITSDNY